MSPVVYEDCPVPPPATKSVPEIVGANVRAPDVGIIVCPKVKPLNAVDVVENVIDVAVVVANPEPRDVIAPEVPPTQTPFTA